jgi:hypothetical protein
MSYIIPDPLEEITVPWSLLVPGRKGHIWFESIRIRDFFLRQMYKWQSDNQLHLLAILLEKSQTVRLGKIIA